MNVASIMVSVDLGPAAADRIQLAASLAMRFEAELVGVAARQISSPTYATSIYASLQVTDVEVAPGGAGPGAGPAHVRPQRRGRRPDRLALRPSRSLDLPGQAGQGG
ncbi:hypothetical protein [Methylobacterium sp. Leaf118]|uniref:hypothetical protein n=1 Tax=Methylobacterium sp. Leaf118 TaxID=2876562 RepID=UPI002FCCC201